MAKVAPFPAITPRAEIPVPEIMSRADSDSVGLSVYDRRPDWFVAEKNPCFYAYRVDYRSGGGMEKSRIGLVARLCPFEVEKRQTPAAVEARADLVEAAVEVEVQLKSACLRDKNYYSVTHLI